jgi:hypothetical protein
MKLGKLIAATFTTATLGLALASTTTLAQEVGIQGLNPGDNADVNHFTYATIRKAEQSLNRNNCALFLNPHSRIVCAYGDAGSRSRLLAAIQRGNARSFTGDGSTLSQYINGVGANQVATDLSNLGIQF